MQQLFTNYKIWIVTVIIALVAGGLAGIGGFYLAQDTSIVPAQPTSNNGGSDLAQQSEQPGMQEDFRASADQEGKVVDVVQKSIDSVVSVVITKELPVYERVYRNPLESEPFFRRFGFRVPELRQKGTEQRQVGAGSGFIVDSKEGLVITNKHVVSREDVNYTVVLNDDTKLEAEVLARDPVQDIAVLQVNETAQLPEALPLGDSQELQLGQSVIAIGNALGEFSNTVSTGVVSGLSRSVSARGPSGSEKLQGVIQTDAAVNPGNSGGPLINLDGEVVGVSTAVAQGAENIGFAIPVNDVKSDIQEVKKTGEISTPFLGVRYTIISSKIARENNLPKDHGALIVRGQERGQIAVVPGSPADKAGLEANDIILEFNGTKITQENPLQGLIGQHDPGDTVTLKVYSEGETKELEVELDKR